jgi:hypothetical protein
MERFNLKKLNEVEGKEHYRVEVSNGLTSLEDLDAEVHINTAWQTVRKNIKISVTESLCYFELKEQKPWSMKDVKKILDQTKRAKLQWLRKRPMYRNKVI